MAMSKPERDTFYTNILLLLSVVFILYISILAVSMIGMSLRRRKKVGRIYVDSKSYVNEETGALYEEKHVKTVGQEMEKDGLVKDLLVDEYTITKVTTDPSLERNEELVKKTHNVSKILFLDSSGRVTSIEEHHLTFVEVFFPSSESIKYKGIEKRNPSKSTADPGETETKNVSKSEDRSKVEVEEKEKK